MARIRSFELSVQNVRVHPTEVDCEHTIVDDGTTRLLHLSTFGSDDRKSEHKSSQSLQLDEERARELITIIRSAFPGIRCD